MTRGTVKSASSTTRTRRLPPLPVPTDNDYPPHGGVGYGGYESEDFKPGTSVQQWIIGAVIVLIIICAVLYIGPERLSGGITG
jgi:hypothetical protein